jgi:hypothetical protein
MLNAAIITIMLGYQVMNGKSHGLKPILQLFQCLILDQSVALGSHTQLNGDLW